MRITILILIILIAKSSLSQNRIIEFKTDKEEPVSYVSLSFPKSGKFFRTDSSGKIALNLSTMHPADSVWISAVGYEEKRLPLEHLSASIILVRRFLVLPEVMVAQGPGVVEIWGTKENPGLLGYTCSQYFVDANQSLGRIVYPDLNYKHALIESVSFYDKEGKDINVPVRLRILFMKKDSVVGEDYLQENLITGSKGKGWLNIDLAGKELLMPKEGLAFVLEFFDYSRELYYREKIIYKDKAGIKHKREQLRYGFRLAREKEFQGHTILKMNPQSSWLIFGRNGPSSCGELVCRVKVRVWR